jgi:uncharacterized protein (DUF983 family)
METFIYGTLVCGVIVAVAMEFAKRMWEKLNPDAVTNVGGVEGIEHKPFPSWLGLVLGAGMSGLVALVYYFGWMPADPFWRCVLVWISTFLFQYFASMEIIKRIVRQLFRKAGVDTAKES